KVIRNMGAKRGVCWGRFRDEASSDRDSMLIARVWVWRGFVVFLFVAEVGFVEEVEAGFGEDGGGEGGVVDMDDDGGAYFFACDEGVAVVDIDFSGEECLGDFGEAVAGGGHFDGDEVANGEAVVGFDEFLGGGVGVVEDETDDGAIETLDDGE